MADSKISQLPVSTVLTGTERVPVVQGGANKTATVVQIRAQGGDWGAQSGTSSRVVVGAVGPLGEPGSQWGLSGDFVAYRDLAEQGVSFAQSGTKILTAKAPIATNNFFYGLTNGMFVTTATKSTGVGVLALNAITSGGDSTGVGYRALSSQNTGTRNVAFGTDSGLNGTALTTGGDNTFIGAFAGITGGGSAATTFGLAVGYSAKTGEKATALGANTVASASGSVAIGTDSGAVGTNTSTVDQIKLGTANQTTLVAGRSRVQANTSGAYANVGGQIFNNKTSVASVAPSSNLQVWTIPAGTLRANGQSVLAYFSNVQVDNANTKTYTYFVAGTSVSSFGVTEAGATYTMAYIRVIRESQSVIRVSTRWQGGLSTAPVLTNSYTRITGLNLDTTSFGIVAQLASATNADVSQLQSRVEWIPEGN